MSDFALPVVREEIGLAWYSGVAASLKRHGRLVGSALSGSGGTAPVYCYFRRHGRQLSCAFSSTRGYLLGESVRDWLAAERDARSFVWCQRLGDTCAVVLVDDGVVLRDALVASADLKRELQLSLNRITPDADGARRLFVHRDVPAADEIAAPLGGRMLSVTVNQWIARQRRPGGSATPELRWLEEYPEVKRWNAVWGWTRRFVLLAVLAGAASWGYDLWRSLQPEPVDEGPSGPTDAQRSYEELRRQSDPGTLVPAIHRAYRDFLGDPLFGAYWQVTRLNWRVDEPATLRIETSLPAVTGEDENDSTPSVVELNAELRGRLANYARNLGWAADVQRSTATFQVPVEHGRRSAAEAEAIRLPEPGATDDRWHTRRLMQDLQVVGGMRVTAERNRPQRDPVYLERFLALELHGVEWSSWDVAAWLGGRLSGGPVVLDTLQLQAIDGTARMRGELKFRMVWCRQVDRASTSCADEE